RLIKLLSRPNRARAQISDSMRSKAQNMRKKGAPVREIAAELGISIPSVYNITKD
ncbi:MAG: Helix-turn-helix domain of resolvase, partial [Verrucomicrobiota bacterium]